jgi:hypothetical protein
MSDKRTAQRAPRPVVAKEWNVRVFVTEQEGRTHAEARLDSGADISLSATGLARLNPDDGDVPEIGDELAVGRALAGLADRLLQTAEEDVADATAHPRRPEPGGGWSS